jgi:hypothetical protein
MPIRSPRLIYEIDVITRNLDDDPAAIDTAPTQTVDGTVSNIYIKMKKAIGDYFGLEPLASNDPVFNGVFGGDGLNKGSSYRRNIGGFKAASYTLKAKTTFVLEEEYYDSIQGTVIQTNKAFRSMSIGFPTGHSVYEVFFWLNSLTNNDKIAAVVTPEGNRHPYNFVPAQV